MHCMYCEQSVDNIRMTSECHSVLQHSDQLSVFQKNVLIHSVLYNLFSVSSLKKNQQNKQVLIHFVFFQKKKEEKTLKVHLK